MLLKLFLNPDVSCYLRELSSEFNASPNAIKVELDSLSNAGYLSKKQNGRSIYFKANKKHPFFPEINSIVRKTLGIDKLIDQIIADIGPVNAVYILDDYAQGKDTGLIDLLVVGQPDETKLTNLAKITEGKIKRKIRVMSVTPDDFTKSSDVFMKRPNWKVL